MFYIIIPTCGRKELEWAVDSVRFQTYKDWELIIVHDGIPIRPEEEKDFANIDGRILDYYSCRKRGSGGARNIGIDMLPKQNEDDYTLFLDDDDELANNNVLKELHEFIEKNNCPDMIRMGYIKHFESGIEKLKKIDPKESDLNVAVGSMRISASAKAVKNRLVAKFPENIKHQDVVQHIIQCDMCDSCAVWDKPFFRYNLYDRPDKAKDSLESRKVVEMLPKYLDWIAGLEVRESTKAAALKWKKKIHEMYGRAEP